MMLLAYCLYDTKVLDYRAPIFVAHHAQVERSLKELVLDPTTEIGRHPHDFHLYFIGDYDSATGLLRSGPIENLGPVAQYLPADLTRLNSTDLLAQVLREKASA